MYFPSLLVQAGTRQLTSELRRALFQCVDFQRFVVQIYFLCICSNPPISILKVLSSIPSGHTVVHVRQKIHSVDKTLFPWFTYSMMLMSIGQFLLHAPHLVHFSFSPAILRREKREVTLRITVIGQRYLQNALLSLRV